MKVFRGVRVAALFVGSVVGAGFATGQEVQFFFGGGSVVNLLTASLFMALASYAFLDMGGKRIPCDKRLSLAADTVVTASSFAVYSAMIAAAEGVLFSLTGVAGFSSILAVLVMLFAGKNTAWLSSLNLIAVPLMAAVIVVVGVRVGGGQSGGALHPIRSLAYGGMNLLFSGALMMKEGATLTRSEKVIAAFFSGVLLFLMLLFMWRSVSMGPNTAMPFLSVASRGGLGTFASVALLLAILTTMASCGYLVSDRLSLLSSDRAFAAPLVTLAGILVSSIGFAPLVRTAYPIVSYLGLAVTFTVLFFALWSLLQKTAMKHRR
ncbi:MAG TPA: hypothetical protein DHV31_00890 [Clostridiales bacterium]|nr:hypothetical protein [Clostridiales bacterium]